MNNSTKRKIIFAIIFVLVFTTGFLTNSILSYLAFPVDFVSNNSQLDIPESFTVTLIGGYSTYSDNVKAYSYYSPPPELPQYPDNRYATISVKFRGWYKDPAYEHMWISGEDQVVCNMHLYAKWS